MELIYVWLILTNVFLLLVTDNVSYKCIRKNYFIWTGIHRDGVLTQLIPRRVPVSYCERLCRLYSDCVGFNINWTDREQENGVCAVISSQCANWINPEITRKGISYYEKRYLGTNIASTLLGTSCRSSNNLNKKATCEKVMNGLLSDRWASSIIDNKQWIQFQFDNAYQMQRIDLYPTCRYRTQCSEFEFRFSDETLIKVC
ncbi:hypothetical protein LSH36_494g00002 [Paralvinella palmiformis]|uniref:Apple domain-containing protein n=1 Tax=Paralvinella palmiformis TaxID=53620 RepID=A0AAD9J8L9_9ANNE|nr:hypothetical protein LSH36_494g00002 [Paralvinella palmiformis]